MSNDFPIPRRTILRGAGAALAFPWLEAMMPSRAKASPQTRRPTRFAALYMPNGVREDTWTPSGRGRTLSSRRPSSRYEI